MFFVRHVVCQVQQGRHMSPLYITKPHLYARKDPMEDPMGEEMVRPVSNAALEPLLP